MPENEISARFPGKKGEICGHSYVMEKAGKGRKKKFSGKFCTLKSATRKIWTFLASVLMVFWLLMTKLLWWWWRSGIQAHTPHLQRGLVSLPCPRSPPKSARFPKYEYRVERTFFVLAPSWLWDHVGICDISERSLYWQFYCIRCQSLFFTSAMLLIFFFAMLLTFSLQCF